MGQQDSPQIYRRYCYNYTHSLELFGKPVLLIELRPVHVFSLLLLLHMLLLHYLKQQAVSGQEAWSVSLLSHAYKVSQACQTVSTIARVKSLMDQRLHSQ